MRINYKESELYKRVNFLTNSPTLSGEEEVVARSGEGIEDPWAKEDQNPGIYGIHPLDENGKIAVEYAKLLKDLHMVDLKPCQPVGPADYVEKANLAMRESKEKKMNEANQIKANIEQQWIRADHKKAKYLEELKEKQSFEATLDKINKKSMKR